MATQLELLLTTVEQYRRQPMREDVVQELHWGQVVTLTRPKAKHIKLQSWQVRLLRPLGEHLGYVESELPFRAVPEYDLRAAEVAFVSRERWDATEDSDDLRGAPELVIEVLSKSNTAREMQEVAALCLSTGTVEFWVLDAEAKAVSVTRREGSTIIYRDGDVISISLFASDIQVSRIFGGK
jgi:Uma2 family endonuclease